MKKKLKKKKKDMTRAAASQPRPKWAEAALPGQDHPDVNPELDILLGGIKDIDNLEDKDDTIIVPTIFPGLNRALHVSGFPTECIVLLHGPSKGGKTVIALGLCASFQIQGHMAVYVDAEHTLDKQLATNCGTDNAQLKYLRPLTYEQTTDRVEKLIRNFAEGRKKKKIHLDRCLIIVVDSITKLVPENELKEMAKAGKGYPLRALMNSNWLDRLTPMIGSLPITFVILAHEKVKIDAGLFGKKWRVKGGESLVYDSTVAMRSKVEESVKITRNKKTIVVGHRHHVTIEKSKVGISHEQWKFVMSNGRDGSPIGIDHARGALEEAKLRGDGVLTRAKGGMWSCKHFDGGKMKGDTKVALWLRENPFVLDEIMADMNVESADAVVSAYDGGDDDSEDDE